MSRSRVRAEFLKSLRGKKGLSQQQLATEAGVPLVTIRRAEQGHVVNPKTIAKLAKCLKVDTAELVEVTEEQALPDAEWRAEFQPLLRQVRKVFSKIDFLGLDYFQDEKPLELTSLYVPPQFANIEVRPHDIPLKPGSEIKLQDLTPETVKSWGKRVVCLAGPGYGKSSFVKWLALQLASQRRNEWREAFDDAIPFPLILREMRLTTEVKTWEKLLDHVKFTQFDADTYVNPNELKKAFAEGRVFVFLDGMDEISGEVRIALHEAIWEGMRKHMNCYWLATSRVQGYELAPLDIPPAALMERNKAKQNDWEFQGRRSLGVNTNDGPRPLTVYFAPFDNGRIQQFAEHWYHQREATAKVAHDKAEDLWQSLNTADDTRRLARVPNLLALMALIHRNTSVLPKGRAELYEKIANSYIDTIDQHRKVADNRYSPEEMRQWLSFIAFEMQSERDGKSGRQDVLISRERILQLIQSAMTSSLRTGDLEQDAELFLRRILERSGLLLEQGQGRYAFVHLSFLEYFAAQHILRKINAALRSRDEKWLSKLREHLNERHWHETFLFLFQILKHKRDHEFHHDVRHTLFGTDWEGGDAIEKHRMQAKLLLLELANDPFTWFDLSYLPPDGPSLATVIEKGIRTLNLGYQSLPDFAILSGLSQLRELNLCRASMSDAGVAHLANLTKLQKLWLEGVRVTDASVAHLAKLTQLQTLDLGSTSVTDASVAHLTILTQLQHLVLGNKSVTDASVVHLTKLTQLQTLKLEGTSITDIGVTKLRNAIPGLHVFGR